MVSECECVTTCTVDQHLTHHSQPLITIVCDSGELPQWIASTLVLTLWLLSSVNVGGTVHLIVASRSQSDEMTQSQPLRQRTAITPPATTTSCHSPIQRVDKEGAAHSPHSLSNAHQTDASRLSDESGLIQASALTTHSLIGMVAEQERRHARS